MHRPRLMPGCTFPHYTYVPGRFPHPFRDPQGHSFGLHPNTPLPLDPLHWLHCPRYLFGIDLFNHGYYWEAHETWEELWHLAGRGTTLGDFLQGLIKLAAAGVKVRQGIASGTRSLAQGARERFQQVQLRIASPCYLGLRFADMLAFTVQAESYATDLPDQEIIRIVFPFVLLPQENPP